MHCAHVHLLGRAGVGAAEAHARAIHQVMRGIAERLVDVPVHVRVKGDHLADGHAVLLELRANLWTAASAFRLSSEPNSPVKFPFCSGGVTVMDAAVVAFVLVALVVGAAHRLAVGQPRGRRREADGRKPSAAARRGGEGARRQPRRGDQACGAGSVAGRSARQRLRSADQGADGGQGGAVGAIRRDQQQAARRRPRRRS